jgi:hypothetical protein
MRRGVRLTEEMAARTLLVRSAPFKILLAVLRLDECWQDKAKPPQKLTKGERRVRAARERASRLKKWRPDVAKFGDQVTVEEALELGNYESIEEMDKDLAKRSKKMSS